MQAVETPMTATSTRKRRLRKLGLAGTLLLTSMVAPGCVFGAAYGAVGTDVPNGSTGCFVLYVFPVACW